MIEYADEIRAARVKRRWNQSELADKAGLYIQTVINIERGDIGIDDPTYRRLMAVIETSEAENAA